MTLVQSILDVFENFLKEKGITIENPEKDNDPDTAILYGTDYSNLEFQIEETLKNALFRDRLNESE